MLSLDGCFSDNTTAMLSAAARLPAVIAIQSPITDFIDWQSDHGNCTVRVKFANGEVFALVYDIHNAAIADLYLRSY